MNKTIIAGSILYSTWGYEQTNVDFYEVIDVSNGWVKLQPVGSVEVETDGFMTAQATPDLSIRKQPFRRKIQDYGHGEYVMINGYQSASVWNGHPVYATHYA